MASRYNTAANSSSFSSRSSTQSSSTSTDLSNPTNKKSSALKRLITGPAAARRGAQPHAPSSAITLVRPKNEQNLTAMVKKFMAKPKKANTISSGDNNYLVIPADFIAEDLKRVVGRKESSGFTAGLHRKLFSGGGKGSGEKTTKALTEVKANTRSLAMVLRSERELLSQCKEQEGEIEELKLVVEEKNREVEKLKDLCLKQREEIKALKSAILFPDVMNSQLQELLEKQGSELKQAKQLIPSLQEQVTSLTGQLQWLAEDLEEVKADKYSLRRRYDPHVSSPETPIYDHEDAVNSLEFSSGYHTTPGSPDDMFVKDLNPCLTPCYATAKSKELEVMSYDSPQDRFLRKHMQYSHDNGSGCHVGKLSKSSDCCCCRNSGGTSAGVAHRSDEIECTYRKKMNQLFS